MLIFICLHKFITSEKYIIKFNKRFALLEKLMEKLDTCIVGGLLYRIVFIAKYIKKKLKKSVFLNNYSKQLPQK